MAEEPMIYMGKIVSNLIKLLPYDFQDLKIFWGLEEELNDLQESMDEVAGFVEDAEEKQDHMVQARRWLTKLRDEAYEADNLLSQLVYETTRFKIQTKQVDSGFPNLKAYLKRAAYRLSMAYKLKKMSESLRSIQRDGQRLQLSPTEHNFEDMMSHNRFLAHSVLENLVVGRDDDVANIVSLMTSSCCRRLTVVPIVGRDGLGKTVLAKLVCQKVMARNLFDVKMWVSVRRNSEEHEIFREMLQSLKGMRIGGLTERGAILQQLEKELMNNKFLLVLDDIDSDDVRWSWHELELRLLKIGVETGNIVLVTTRSERVASIIETSYEHRHTLDSLSDQECRLILEERVFRNVTAPYPSCLGAIGWDIVRKCRGVPLVAKVIGGTMRFYRDEETWLKIRDSDGLSGVQTDVLSILKVSFDHLPSYLKPCFTFCSVFPRGFSIRKEELIQLWMAEGFVESRDEGNRYFYTLLGNSFFEDAEMDDNGEVIQCKMHDLLHDLALFVSKFESSLYRLYADDLFTTASMGILKDRPEKLRTVIVNCATYHKYSRELKLLLFTYHEYSWELKRLRTLHLNGANAKVFPSSISRVKYLRYLDFSNSESEELPESSTMLYNLQVLNLSDSKIKKLSASITNLYNLRSLNLSNSKIQELPEPVTQLHNLRTLNLSNSNIKELPKYIDELKNLQTLNLAYSDIEVLPESITSLLNLQTLDVSNCNIKELPESIGKLHNLQTLNVSMSKIIKLPESITNLHNLQTLKFVNCEELIDLPRKKIRNLINLKHIVFSSEFYMPFGLGQLHGLETLPFFVVGFDQGGSIQELESLNQLRGHLEIARLEEVEDTNEAKRANLQGKTRLQGVGFKWSYGENDRSSQDKELLECLRPNANIRRIKIKYYMGEKWPSWMLTIKSPNNVGASRVLNNLVDLSLERCWNCEQLPRLGDLVCLQFLRISHMKRLKCIGNEFYGIDSVDNLRPFPALKLLSLSWMENLTEWRSPLGDDRVIFFPCLENLSIQSCAKLTGFPVKFLSALTNLEIKDCEDFRFVFGQQSLPSLTSLSVVGCSKLIYLRNLLPPSSYFKDLSLRRCEWLTFIPEDFGKLSSLTSLEMYCCKRLRCFSEEIISELTQLKHIRIGAFSKELDDFRYLNRIKDLTRLEELELWGSDFFGREISSLPDQLQHLTSLKSLKIMGFTVMEALPEWLTNLQSLQSISLDYCRHLECQSTATVLQCLSNLAHLYVDCCPVLEEANLQFLLLINGAKTKVQFSDVSKVRVRLGY